jgi:molybdopterin-guanine dinucleotide biosynthesis protein A
MSPTLFGLVLAGGASTRMQRDKATLSYHGKPQLQWAYELLSDVCAATFISVRPDQRDEPTRAALPQIVDTRPGIGPIAGISAALTQHPKAAWLVVACDLPFLTADLLQHLIAHRNPGSLATAYRSAHDSLPEPLCAIWEPAAREPVIAYVAAGKQCPRKFLINANTHLLDLPDANALDNINTGAEYEDTKAKFGSGPRARVPGQNATEAPHDAPVRAPSAESRLSVRVRYYALFREQAGRSEETLETNAATPAQLYRELQGRYSFKLASHQLKVAVNEEFAAWDAKLSNGDAVVFIPPVAGG